MAQKPNKVVLAAISAAVTCYLNTQQETFLPAPSETAISMAGGSSFYGVYGRQQIMEMRRIVSLRLNRR